MTTIGIYYHSYLLPMAGGVATVSCWLARGLLKCGYRVVLLNPSGFGALDCPEIKVAALKADGRKPYRSAVLAAVKNEKLDLIVNQSSLSANSIPLTNVGIPVITVLHNNPSPVKQPYVRKQVVGNWKGRLWARCYNAFPRFTSVLGSLRTWLLQQRILSFSSVFCVLSPSYMGRFRLCCKLWRTRLVAIPNPIPFTHEETTTAERVVVWVGRLTRIEKRVDWLLEIWRRAFGKSTEQRLIIVGDGNDRGALEEFVNKNKLNVEFVGKTDPRLYYKRASLIALTSPSEGFPLVLTEAMSYGVVPIVFDSFSAARDVITDGVNGILVKPFDLDQFAEKLTVAVNSDLESYRREAKIRSEEFSEKKVLAKWRELIDETLLHKS